MSISAFDKENNLLQKEVYYSIGGGFIKTEAQMTDTSNTQDVKLAFPFTSADSLLKLADAAGLSIGTLIQRNELSYRSAGANRSKNRANLESYFLMFRAGPKNRRYFRRWT